MGCCCSQIPEDDELAVESDSKQKLLREENISQVQTHAREEMDEGLQRASEERLIAWEKNRKIQLKKNKIMRRKSGTPETSDWAKVVHDVVDENPSIEPDLKKKTTGSGTLQVKGTTL